MNKQESLVQLEIAKQILEKDLPWEAFHHGHWTERTGSNPCFYMSGGIKLRIKPEPVKVPLGPEDVPPGSVLHGPSDKPEVWAAVMAMTPHGIMLADSRSVSFAVIENGWKINRSLSNGKWDPTAWEPCYKEVTEQ